jgi:conjugative relaxase-like TrwC/TraI family protein
VLRPDGGYAKSPHTTPTELEKICTLNRSKLHRTRGITILTEGVIDTGDRASFSPLSRDLITVMLSISNASASRAAHYYTKDDYYSQEECTTPYWFGQGAESLGLPQEVEKNAFQQLLRGTAPDGGSLSGKKIQLEKRRAATDFTFSAPKGVSIAALVQKDERVLQAHHQAVNAALLVLEQRYAQTRVSTIAGRQQVKTGNLVAAIFTHATSREVEPQLHSHCVVINATQLPDGRWQSWSNDGAIAHQKLLGQIYQNELALRLRQLGYGIEGRLHGQFELVGYAPELLKVFSTRRQQIEALLAQWQTAGGAQREAAALQSRKNKTQGVAAELLERGWNQVIEQHQLELPPIPKLSSDSGDGVAPNLAVERAIAHCGEREAIFRQAQIERFVLEHHLGEYQFGDIGCAIDEHQELIRVEPGKYTTQSALSLELETIRLMDLGKGQVTQIGTTETIDRYLENKHLTAGQRQAVERSLFTSDQIIGWQGIAGSGKSFALAEVKAIAQQQGYLVRGFAPSSESAHELGRSLEIEADTVARLLITPEVSQASNQPETWIVDEAGLLSMRAAHDLLTRAKAENARVILVGDTRQLSAVEAGNPFRSLQAAGMAIAHLDENLRQQTQALKEAVNLIAQSQVAAGVGTLARAECIRAIAAPTERLQQIADDYLGLSVGQRQKTLLLAGTNRERAELTDLIRRQLQAEGAIGKNALTVSGLRSRDLTTTQARYASAYEVRDILVPNQDYKKQGLRRAEAYEVMESDRITNTLTLQTDDGKRLVVNPDRFEKKSVYQTQQIEIAVGDRLRWTKNNRAEGFRNGQVFTVRQVDPNGVIQAIDSEGKSFQVDLNNHQYIDYAYVHTTYSSQGKTADRVLALLNETANRETFYVAISRAKHHLTLYTDEIAALTQRVQKSRAKENVSDYIPLFQVVNSHAQTPQTQTESCSSGDDFDRLGERLSQDVRQQLTAPLRRSEHTESTTDALGRGDERSEESDRPRPELGETRERSFGGNHAELERDIASLTTSLDDCVEGVSEAITDHAERQELLECGDELEAAVTAINHRFERLEQAIENRNRFAAAVARLHATVAKQAGQIEFAARSQRRSGINTTVPAAVPLGDCLVHGQAWQKYSQEVRSSNPVKLDYLVARRAFEEGWALKDIGRMLIVGSPYVRAMHWEKGKDKTRQYVNQTIKLACQRRQKQQIVLKKELNRQLELGM